MNVCRSCGKEVPDAEFVAIEGEYGLCDDCASEEAEQDEALFNVEKAEPDYVEILTDINNYSLEQEGIRLPDEWRGKP